LRYSEFDVMLLGDEAAFAMVCLVTYGAYSGGIGIVLFLDG